MLPINIVESSNNGYDGVPLTVDFRQSAAAVGRIPTNYLRRELGQSDADILASRVIDRSIRPLIQSGWTSETQIICEPLSIDDDGDSVLLGLNAAACAMDLSSIPMISPIAGVRVAIVDEKVVLNPPRSVLRDCSMDMILSGTTDRKVVMLEMEGHQISQELVLEAIQSGLDGVDRLLHSMAQLREKAGKEKNQVETKDHSVNCDVGENSINLKTGHMARFADAAVVASSGDNAVLATCVHKQSNNGYDGVPLTVDFRQSAAAVGRIPTNYVDYGVGDAAVVASNGEKVLTDILGIEDYAGDTDFEGAETRNGSTAMQLDIKIPGLTPTQLSEALHKGTEGISFVLDKMASSLPQSRDNFKPTVPVLETMHLEQFKRAMIFSNGGYIAKNIKAETDVEISVDDDTHICMIAPNRQKLSDAKEMLQRLLNEKFLALYEVNSIPALVVEVLSCGVLVILQPGGKKYIVPNSQLSTVKVNHPTEAGIKLNTIITVQWKGREGGGEVELSRVFPGECDFSDRFIGCQELESNGFSMASACSGSLALFDADVIAAPVAGVAIGRITDDGIREDDYKVMCYVFGCEVDINNLHGKPYQNLLQLEMRLPDIPPVKVWENLPPGTKTVTVTIDEFYEKAFSLPQSRDIFKPTVPVLETMHLEQFKRAMIFRNGGYIAKNIEAETDVKIAQGNGNICFVGRNVQKIKIAKDLMRKMVNEALISEYYSGPVTWIVFEILDGGVLVVMQPGGKPQFLPISELSDKSILPSELGLKIGQEIVLHWLGRDGTGNVRLSRKPLSGSAAPVTNNFRK